MAFLDPVLGPILNLPPAAAILLISLVISLIIVLAYKYFTNQEAMKELKMQQKEYQKRMKELRSNPDEMMKVQKEAMGKNMEYMKHSLRATLITLLPIILIIGWMNTHFAFEPIYPGETYSMTAEFAKGVNGEAELIPDEGTELQTEAIVPINSETTWHLKSTEGTHILTVKAGEQQQTKKVLITENLNYEQQVASFPHSDIEKIKINYNKLRPLGSDFSLFGWQPGWLGVYIILSIVFSLGLRKVFKVY